MVPALIVLLLTQTPELEPPVVETPQVAPAPADGMTPVRVTASFAGALVGFTPAALLVVFSQQICGRSDVCQFYLPMLGIMLTPAMTAMGAWLGHRLAGGKAKIYMALGGAGVGFIAMFGTAAAIIGVHASFSQRLDERLAYGVLGAATIAMATVVTGVLENSHHRERASVGFLVAPVPGGAMARLSGSF